MESDFGFPFPPYSIQTDFMRQLFQVLDNGQLGIFESPTGTGKSLSIICATLTWLKYHEEKRRKDLEEQVWIFFVAPLFFEAFVPLSWHAVGLLRVW